MGVPKKKNLNKLFTKYKDIRGFKYIWNMKSFKRRVFFFFGNATQQGWG